MVKQDEKELIDMTDELKILCPFCNAPYTAKMKAEYDYSMGSEFTGRYGEEIKVKIYCGNCKRLVYTKAEEIS